MWKCHKIVKGFSAFTDKLHERQRDPDEKARQEVVVTICEAASENIDSVTDQVVYRTTFLLLGKYSVIIIFIVPHVLYVVYLGLPSLYTGHPHFILYFFIYLLYSSSFLISASLSVNKSMQYIICIVCEYYFSGAVKILLSHFLVAFCHFNSFLKMCVKELEIRRCVS